MGINILTIYICETFQSDHFEVNNYFKETDLLIFMV